MRPLLSLLRALMHFFVAVTLLARVSSRRPRMHLPSAKLIGYLVLAASDFRFIYRDPLAIVDNLWCGLWQAY